MVPVGTILLHVLLFALSRSAVGDRCTLGTTTDAASLFLGAGQYLDWSHPLKCNGSLTKWHFCYYPEDIHQNGDYRVYFRIWRPENENALRLFYTKEMFMPITQPNSFTCATITLDMDEYTAVLEGDILGVYISIFQSRTLHIIGEGDSGPGLYFDQRGFITSFNEREVTFEDVQFKENLGLHLCADIATDSEESLSPGPTTVIPPVSTFSVKPLTVPSAADGHSPSDMTTTAQPSTVQPSTPVVPLSVSLTESPVSKLTNQPVREPTAPSTSLPPSTSPSLQPIQSTSMYEPLTTTTPPVRTAMLSQSGPSLSTSQSRPMVSMNPVDLGDGGSISIQLSAGAAAAIVVPVIFLVVITLCVLVVLIFVVVRRRRSVSRIPTQRSSAFYMDNVVYTGIISDHVPAPPEEFPSHYEVPTDLELPRIEVSYNSNGIRSNPQPYEVPLSALLASNKTTQVSTSAQSLVSHESNYVEMGSDTAVRSQPSLEGSSASNQDRSSKAQSVASTMSEDLDPTSHYYQLLEQAYEGVVEQYRAPPSTEEELLAVLSQQDNLSICRCDIQLDSHVACGQFGMVEKGVWRSTQGDVEVAVKSLPDRPSQEDKIKLLQEAAIMGQFRHPNVVQLYGVMATGNPVMLVIEYLPRKDLRRQLVKMGRTTLPAGTPLRLLHFCQQVALGMHYLASKGFVHRDLAARNVFVSHDNVCKIGDFGMSRDLANADYYVSHGGKIPVRWTAPEAMYFRKYSTASDVWSYGCLLYEVWSLGRMPFKDFTNAQVIDKVDSGYRLPPPAGCPRAIYELMIRCWNPHPPVRPGFRDILLHLLGDDRVLLHIPPIDASTNVHANTLGASTQAGGYMYKDLQVTYLSPEEKSDYEQIPERKYILSFPTSSADLDGMFDDSTISSGTLRQSYRKTLLTNDTGSDYEDISQ